MLTEVKSRHLAPRLPNSFRNDTVSAMHSKIKKGRRKTEVKVLILAFQHCISFRIPPVEKYVRRSLSLEIITGNLSALHMWATARSEPFLPEGPSLGSQEQGLAIEHIQFPSSHVYIL